MIFHIIIKMSLSGPLYLYFAPLFLEEIDLLSEVLFVVPS